MTSCKIRLKNDSGAESSTQAEACTAELTVTVKGISTKASSPMRTSRRALLRGEKNKKGDVCFPQPLKAFGFAQKLAPSDRGLRGGLERLLGVGSAERLLREPWEFHAAGVVKVPWRGWRGF